MAETKTMMTMDEWIERELANAPEGTAERVAAAIERACRSSRPKGVLRTAS